MLLVVTAAQVLAAGLFNWWTPPNQPWGEYEVPEELKQNDASDEATQWLGKDSDKAMREIGRSNFYSTKATGDLGFSVFATDLIIADEPTGNLDSKTGEIVLDTFKKLNKEHGRTIVLITHEHADHFHIDSLKELLKNQPEVVVVCDIGVGAILAREGVLHHVMEQGNNIDVKGVHIEAFGKDHAILHSSLPLIFSPLVETDLPNYWKSSSAH
jgi:hypothetical protein